MVLRAVEWDWSTMLCHCVRGFLFRMEEAVRYANERVQSGQSIDSFQAIRYKIADIKIIMEACRLAAYRGVALKDAEATAKHY